MMSTPPPDPAPSDTARPDRLKSTAGRALEAALDRLLALDPDTRTALSALDGRRVVLTLTAPRLALALTVDGERVRVGRAPDDPAVDADLAVRGTLGALLAQVHWLRPDDGAARLHVSGDAELARRLQNLARGFDPDWGRPFAEVFGDVIGGTLARAIERALKAGLASVDTLVRDGADYLTEESRDLVARAELDRFHDDVDALRDAVERAEARVQRLLERRSEPAR